MPKAGITPDSIFYGFDVFFDNLRVALTFRAVNKAKLRLDIMQERMAEMEQMAENNQIAEAEKAEAQVQEQMQKFEGSVEKIEKKDAEELQEHIQTHAEILEILKQRLEDYDSDWADAILDALEILEASENTLANIPEDLDFESAFVFTPGTSTFESMIAQCIEAGESPETCAEIEDFCKEMKAPTAEECVEMFSSGFLTAVITSGPPGSRPPDPHNCSGFWSSYISQTKWCCKDSDGIYSPEYVERMISEGRGEIPSYYHRKGTVEYKIINLRTQEIEQGIERDSCDGDTLTEWLCPTSLNRVTRNERYSEEYECPLGCEDGACIPRYFSATEEFEGECVDSDGGQDYYIKGVISGKAPTGLASSQIDHCLTDSTLAEFLCGDNDLVLLDAHDCPNGCQDGVCISS
jgi:hypothetical protein